MQNITCSGLDNAVEASGATIGALAKLLGKLLGGFQVRLQVGPLERFLGRPLVELLASFLGTFLREGPGEAPGELWMDGKLCTSNFNTSPISCTSCVHTMRKSGTLCGIPRIRLYRRTTRSTFHSRRTCSRHSRQKQTDSYRHNAYSTSSSINRSNSARACWTGTRTRKSSSSSDRRYSNNDNKNSKASSRRGRRTRSNRHNSSRSRTRGRRTRSNRHHSNRLPPTQAQQARQDPPQAQPPHRLSRSHGFLSLATGWAPRRRRAFPRPRLRRQPRGARALPKLAAKPLTAAHATTKPRPASSSQAAAEQQQSSSRAAACSSRQQQSRSQQQPPSSQQPAAGSQQPTVAAQQPAASNLYKKTTGFAPPTSCFPGASRKLPRCFPAASQVLPWSFLAELRRRGRRRRNKNNMTKKKHKIIRSGSTGRGMLQLFALQPANCKPSFVCTGSMLRHKQHVSAGLAAAGDGDVYMSKMQCSNRFGKPNIP